MATYSSVLPGESQGLGRLVGCRLWGRTELDIAVKRREAKSNGEKEIYKHLNAEFQRRARRDKIILGILLSALYSPKIPWWVRLCLLCSHVSLDHIPLFP